MTIKNIKEYCNNSLNKSITLFDLILNPKAREKYYRDNDSDYKETEDEKEIFNEANKRRMRDNK